MIKSLRLRWADHVVRMEEGMSSSKMLTGTPTGKRSLGRPRHRWNDLKQIGIIPGIGLILLRIGIIGEPLWMQHWTYGLHGISYINNSLLRKFTVVVAIATGMFLQLGCLRGSPTTRSCLTNGSMETGFTSLQSIEPNECVSWTSPVLKFRIDLLQSLTLSMF